MCNPLKIKTIIIIIIIIIVKSEVAFCGLWSGLTLFAPACLSGYFGMRTAKTQTSLHILITKTYLYNFDPLKPHFYIVKLGFTGIYIIFLIFAQNHICGYSLEPPRRGGSNEYPQSMFWAEIWKLSDFFLSENFHFLVAKFSVYLNRHIFVMFLSNKADWNNFRYKII